MPVQIGKKPENDFTNPLGLLSDCHRRIEHFLGVLLDVTRQAKGGALDDPQGEALGVALRYFRETAPKHTLDEEDSLFPRMRASRHDESADARALIEMLHHDHEEAESAHAEVDRLGAEWLNNGRLDAEKAEQLEGLLSDLANTYERHILAEDSQVFPLAGRILEAAQVQEIGKEMAARRGVAFGFVSFDEKKP